MGAIGIGTPIYYHSTPTRPGAVTDKPEFVFEVLAAAGNIIDLTTRNAGSAANFIINWGEGADQTISGTSASHTFASSGTKVVKINKLGTVTPVNDFAVLATNQGRSIVTKVTNWGSTEWYRLFEAFRECVNLETIVTDVKLKTAPITNQLFRSTFQGCTKLQSADMSNWVIPLDTSNPNYRWDMKQTFSGCTDLALIKPMASKVMPVKDFSQTFEFCGAALAAGAVVENFDSLDFSTSTAISFYKLFFNAKLSGDVNLSNWVSLYNINNSSEMFHYTELTGDNPTLNCSGWSSIQAVTMQSMFKQLNRFATEENNLTINVSNLNVSKTTNMAQFWGYGPNSAAQPNRVENIIGLSTWVAPNTDLSAPKASDGEVSMFMFFGNCPYLKLVANDNLSDTFVNGAKPTSISGAFQNISYLRAIGDKSVAPNLGSLDLSGITGTTGSGGLDGLFLNTNTSDSIDLSNVIFPTAFVTYQNIFSRYQSDNPGVLDLSTKDIKPSSLSQAFRGITTTPTSKKTSFTKVIFGEFSQGTDFSFCTTFSFCFSGAGDSTNPFEVILPIDANYQNVTIWSSAFSTLYGPGGVNLTTCVANTLIRRLKASALTGNGQLINLPNSKYSGPQALVGNDLASLLSATPPYTFGTLSSEDPYFSIPSYVSPSGTTQNITFASGVADDGTWTVTNGVATIDNSTPANTTITSAAGSNGTGKVRYTLTDGCYNEVAFTATIPLIANNFSFNFDGINDYLEVDGDPLKISGVQQNRFTISTWINFNGSGGQFQVVGGMRNTTRPFSYGVRLNGSTATGPWKVNFLLSSATDSINNYQMEADANIIPNNWVHVACVADGTASPVNTRMKLYIDGILQTTDTVNWTDGNVQPSQNPLILGAYQLPAPVGSFFDGKIDEWALWNTPLTGPQILDIYNGRLGVTNETVDLSKYDGLGGNLVYWNRMGD